MIPRILFVLSVLFLAACASTDPQERQLPPAAAPVAAPALEAALMEKSTDTPAWKNEGHFEADGRHYFVGSAAGIGDRDEAKGKALSNALSSVSRWIRVAVKAETKSYQEQVGNAAGGVLMDTSKESGALITVRQYDEANYTETWNRGGRIEYDAFVRVAITADNMKKLQIEAAGITAWAVAPGNACTITRESDTFIRETAARKGWKLAPTPTTLTAEGDIEKLFVEPKDAYFLLFRPLCATAQGSVTAKIAFEHYALIERSTANTITAEATASTQAEALRKAEEAMQKALFSYSGALFSPQMPEVTAQTTLSELDVELLQLFEKAKKVDAEGWLLPAAAMAKWQELADKPDPNPYKQTALDRVTLWKKYQGDRTALGEKRKLDREKLVKALPLTVVSFDEKVRYLREYLYAYGTLFGADETFELIDTLPDKAAAKKLKEGLFDPALVGEWQIACDRNDGAACYFLGVAQGASGENALRKGCDAQVGMACHAIAKRAKSDTRYRKAAEAAKKACTYGVSNSCFLAGMVYYAGASDVNADISAARGLFEKACETGNNGGCAYLGWMYENGEGVTKDRDTAKQYYLKACNLGHAKSCERAGD